MSSGIGVGAGVGATSELASKLAPLGRVTVTGVTTLDLDHTQTLGSTLAEIANEKGGIFKKGGALLRIFLHKITQQASKHTRVRIAFPCPHKHTACALLRMLVNRHFEINSPN